MIPREVRKTVLERAHYDRPQFEVLGHQIGRCEECGVESVDLELHHLRYSNIHEVGPEDATSIEGRETPDDLKALCRQCHLDKHIGPLGEFYDDPEECAGEWDYYYHMTEKDD